MPLDTLLCDLGNVLAPFDFSRVGRRFAELSGKPLADVLPKLRGADYLAMETGTIGPETFHQRLTAQLGVRLSFEAFREAWNDIFTVDQEMAALVGRIAESHPVFLWSNTSHLHLEYLRERIPVMERFAGLHVSYELGAMKPDPAYYAAAIAKGKLVPERCVFVDDVQANLNGARAFGIVGVLHTSAAQTRAQLERLGFPLP